MSDLESLDDVYPGRLEATDHLNPYGGFATNDLLADYAERYANDAQWAGRLGEFDGAASADVGFKLLSDTWQFLYCSLDGSGGTGRPWSIIRPVKHNNRKAVGLVFAEAGRHGSPAIWLDRHRRQSVLLSCEVESERQDQVLCTDFKVSNNLIKTLESVDGSRKPWFCCHEHHPDQESIRHN